MSDEHEMSINFDELETIEELWDALEQIYHHQLHHLTDLGVSQHSALAILKSFAEIEKASTATYVRLLQAGKIPADKQLQPHPTRKDIQI